MNYKRPPKKLKKCFRRQNSERCISKWARSSAGQRWAGFPKKY